MTLLFDRRAELRLYTQNEEHVLSSYDMSFNVFLTSKSEPNTATVSIWGLSEAQRNLFNGELIYLEVYAGYKDDINMIFRGSWNPAKSIADHYKDGPVWLTTIETGDGLKEVSVAFVNKSYSAGTLLSKIINDITSLFGLPVVMDFHRDESILHAATYTGRASQILDDLAWWFKFDWSIQYGTVIITERDEPSTSVAAATVLSHSTGLIGQPAVTNDGVVCNTMMLSNIKPKSLIEIKDESLSGRIETLALRSKDRMAKTLRSSISNAGIYVVDTVNYAGTLKGSDWGCEVRALFK